MANAMEVLGEAVAVLDAAARPLAINPPFHALLADGWFVQHHGAIAPADASRASRFATIVASSATVMGSAPPAVSGGEVVLRHPLRRGLMLARVLAQSTPGPTALVIVHDPARARAPQPESLREAFGLTAAETHLSLALVEGQTLAEHAARRGISLSTAKTQLSNLFARTGTARQAELVRLIAGFCR